MVNKQNEFALGHDPVPGVKALERKTEKDFCAAVKPAPAGDIPKMSSEQQHPIPTSSPSIWRTNGLQ